MEDFFGENGRLAGLIDHYQPRSGQQEMAQAVSRSLMDSNDPDPHAVSAPPRVLVVEAETGIGKTLAYLLPAVISGKRVVVSTATRNLQDQIIHKEIPLLEKMFGGRVSAQCVKGRQNYLCLYKWYQHRSSAQLSLIAQDDEDKIEQWLASTVTGDRAELHWLADDASLWHKISSQSDQCLGSECPEQENCFISRLRRRAAAARILIVNHHLFFSDLALKKEGYGEILPRYQAVIFDEAHHLEDIATTFFAKSFSSYQLRDILSDAERLGDKILVSDEHKNLLSRLSGMRVRLNAFMHVFPKKRGKTALKELVTEYGQEAWQQEVELLATGIAKLIVALTDLHFKGEGWQTLVRRCQECHDNLRLTGLARDTTSSNYVHWFEHREKSIVLSVTPISVAKELNEFLYAGVESTIMTSATLSIGEKFDYLRERLGLPADTKYLRFASPFAYKEQALLYIPEGGFPETNAPDYGQKSCERILQILEQSRGRALILFTSFSAMERAATWLTDKIDYRMLVQGRHSRKHLLEEFKADRDSVLLAVASFWEGIDVAGEALSCVIIDKLPFEVPTDPVIQARMEYIKAAGGNPFMDFQVPRAVLTLRQGVGRLMRSDRDRGLITILDIRLFSKFYGKRFLRSLPPAPVTRSLDEVKKFFSTEKTL
ncbi:ATP-dependent DNA helicase [Desulfotalea psychrophila]|uniref:ATP-dependent DNA helicase n=1 Tax=Desulfotalea psychrophila TaxID=84980 RepID=UPI00031E1E4C|nr:ATP-dependent DNA helicase [Desulfotalea psychrophila]